MAAAKTTELRPRLRAVRTNPITTRIEFRTRRVHVSEPHDVLCTRPNRWCNPFVIGRDGDRDEVIRQHKKMLVCRDDLLARIGELRGKRLACVCKKTERCHVDFICVLADAL